MSTAFAEVVLAGKKPPAHFMVFVNDKAEPAVPLLVVTKVNENVSIPDPNVGKFEKVICVFLVMVTLYTVDPVAFVLRGIVTEEESAGE